jgi:hypothetical protein
VSQSLAQTKLRSTLDRVVDYSSRMKNYADDFEGFQKAQAHSMDKLEILTTDNLDMVAIQTFDFLMAVASLVTVYSNITKDADSRRAKPIIKKLFDYYAEQIGVNVGRVNYWLAYTKSPAMAASGTRLKEDLREIKTLIESIDLP